MWVDTTWFTADTLQVRNLAKIYGHYNNSCNIRGYAVLPTGQPAMIQVVKIDKSKQNKIYEQVFCLPSSQ